MQLSSPHFYLRKALVAAVLLPLASPASGNVVGNDLQNFNATTNGIDYVTVQASELLKPRYIHLGLMLNYAVNSLPYFEAADQSRLDMNDSLLTSEFLAGYGLFEFLELGLGFSYLLRQKIDNQNSSHGNFSATGLTNIRANLKAPLFKIGPLGTAITLNASRNLIKDNPYIGKDEALIYGVEWIGDLDLGPIHLASNFGYRWRKQGKPLDDMPIKPTRDQITGSLALSTLLPALDTKLIAELYGSKPTKHQRDSSDRQASSGELLLGIKHDYRRDVAMHVGVGSEAIHGAFSPDWRLYAGLNYTTTGSLPAVLRVDQPEEAFVFVNRSEKEDLLRIPNLQFDFNSDKISSGSIYRLQSIFQFLAKSNYQRIVVEGHTDSIGSASFNQKLSERRAASVMQVFVKSGIPSGQIARIGFGETQPIADNGNFQGRELNRRVEIRVIR